MKSIQNLESLRKSERQIKNSGLEVLGLNFHLKEYFPTEPFIWIKVGIKI